MTRWIILLAVPVLQGCQYNALISPLLVYLLLTKVSGVPMLERRGQKLWGEDAEYQDYVARVALLIPGRPRPSA